MWIWVVSNIAGSLLGAASARWIKDTKVGIWGYKKFVDIANWAQERYGIDILDTDDSTIRAVFHLHITDEDLEKAIEAFEQIR